MKHFIRVVIGRDECAPVHYTPLGFNLPLMYRLFEFLFFRYARAGKRFIRAVIGRDECIPVHDTYPPNNMNFLKDFFSIKHGRTSTPRAHPEKRRGRGGHQGEAALKAQTPVLPKTRETEVPTHAPPLLFVKGDTTWVLASA